MSTRVPGVSVCWAESSLGSNCGRYLGHDGPHMTFDPSGAWSAQWPAERGEPLHGWEEWTREKEEAHEW